MDRDWPADDVVRALAPSTRDVDGRERRELVTIRTLGATPGAGVARLLSTLVMRTHPGTGDMTFTIDSKECR